MRGMLCAAVIAALASANAGAADWTKVLDSDPGFPTRLAVRGLAIDDAGFVAVQTYNRLAWSGQIEFIHEYTLDANGQVPWIWGLVGRGYSEGFAPRGVDQRDGFRLIALERTDDAWSPVRDELAVVQPGSSQPSGWLSEPRIDGHVVGAVSGGHEGGFALRALDAGAGFEVVAFDGPSPRWRTTVQPCAPGAAPQHLTIDYASPLAWPMPHAVSVAGSCDDGIGPVQIFVQRFDTQDGAPAALDARFANPDAELLQLAFSPTHEAVAVFGTPWPHKEVHRIGAPGAPSLPPDLLFMDQVTAFAPGAGDGLAIVGTDFAGEPAVATVKPFQPTSFPLPQAGLSAFPGGGWAFASGRDDRRLAFRVETGGLTPLLRLVGLDALGGLEWTGTIADVLDGSVPQAIPAKDPAGGFVVAVDTQDANGTIGVHVQRVGSLP